VSSSGAIAISGNTLVVGACGEGLNVGAAYTFERVANVWNNGARLSAPFPESNDYFGCSVGVSGDLVVVGAQREDSSSRTLNGDGSNNLRPNSGAAFIFGRNGTTWSQQAYVKASNADNEDRFGASVAVSSLGNVSVVIVGAPMEDGGDALISSDNNAADAGAAYAFTKVGSASWTQNAILKAYHPGAGDRFGADVAISGFNALIGAPGEDSNHRGLGRTTGDDLDNSASDSGAAYLFTYQGSANNWWLPKYLKSENSDPGDGFGSAVAISGENLLIGAPTEDGQANALSNSGAVYTVVAQRGSISVTITPAAAVTAGAKWRRATSSGPWLDSGATETGVEAGVHTIYFLGVSGWAVPDNIYATVAYAQTTSLSAAYRGGAAISGYSENIQQGPYVFGFQGSNDSWGDDISFAPDGKIVLAGGRLGGGFVARFTSAGQLDGSFNATGYRGLNGNASVREWASGLSLAPDGRIFASGTFYYFDEYYSEYKGRNFGLYEISSTGGLTQVRSNLGGNIGDCLGLTRDGAGRFFVYGSWDDWGESGSFFTTKSQILRLDESGFLDSAFASNGVATLSDIFRPGSALLQKVSVNAGKILVSGLKKNFGWDFPALARLTSAGTVDLSFGPSGNGYALPFSSAGWTSASPPPVVLLSDDTIIMGDSGYLSTNGMTLFRYNSNGTTFATITAPFSSEIPVTDLAMQSDGKILAVGPTTSGIAIARFNPNGSLDSTFDTDGLLTATRPAGQSAYKKVHIAVHSDGTIAVAAGPAGFLGASNYSVGYITLYRFYPDGSPDVVPNSLRTIRVQGANLTNAFARVGGSYVNVSVLSDSEILIYPPTNNNSSTVTIQTGAGSVTKDGNLLWGQQLLAEGTTYQAVNPLIGIGKRQNDSWDLDAISFTDNSAPHGFNRVVNPNIAAGTDGTPTYNRPQDNFDEAKLMQAQTKFRSVLAVTPDNLDAQVGILEAIYHRMAVRNFAAQNYAAWARKQRLYAGATTAKTAEINAVETADYHFKKVAEILGEAMGDTVDYGLLSGTRVGYQATFFANDLALQKANIFGPDDILECFGRSLDSRALNYREIMLRKYEQSYADELRTPGSWNRTALLQQFNVALNEISLATLLVEPLRSRVGFYWGGVDGLNNTLSILADLRSTMSQGEVILLAPGSGWSSDAVRPDLEFYRYGPSYVAFYPDAGTNGSFGFLHQRATDHVTDAKTAETNAKNAALTVAQNNGQLNTDLENLRRQYFGELQLLCGYGQLEEPPDLINALLPAEIRDTLPATGALTSQGQIYQQWLNVHTTERELELAIVSYTQVLTRIETSRAISEEVADINYNAGAIVLANGQRLAALERQRADVAAWAARKREEIEVQRQIELQATESPGFFGWVGAVAGAIPTFGASVANALDRETTSWAARAGILEDEYKVAADAAKALSDAEAVAAARNGAISAEQQMITAQQGALSYFNAARTELLKNGEQLLALEQEAVRLRMQVRLTEHRLTQQRAELANLYDRVAYLLAEYKKALLRTQDPSFNPLVMPDFRLLKDSAAREAEERFLRGKRSAYLAAKALQYVDNFSGQKPVGAGGTTPTFTDNISGQLVAIVKARTAAELESIVNGLDDIYVSLKTARNGTNALTVIVSVRNYIAQNNYLEIDSNGNPVPGTAVLQQQTQSLLPAGAQRLELSNEAWRQVLEYWCLKPGETRPGTTITHTGPAILEIPISLDLSRAAAASELPLFKQRVNPLYYSNRYGDLIRHDGSVQGLGMGVELRIDARNIEFNSGQSAMRAELEAEGVALIRSRPDAQETDGSGIRRWLLPSATDQMDVGINAYLGYGTKQLRERSPANERWIFRVREDTVNESIFLYNLDKVTDIKIRFRLEGWVGQ
jgi:uncharacterized delta-60 repeat protein